MNSLLAVFWETSGPPKTKGSACESAGWVGLIMVSPASFHPTVILITDVHRFTKLAWQDMSGALSRPKTDQ
jgi:hypothetical protein